VQSKQKFSGSKLPEAPGKRKGLAKIRAGIGCRQSPRNERKAMRWEIQQRKKRKPPSRIRALRARDERGRYRAYMRETAKRNLHQLKSAEAVGKRAQEGNPHDLQPGAGRASAAEDKGSRAAGSGKNILILLNEKDSAQGFARLKGKVRRRATLGEGKGEVSLQIRKVTGAIQRHRWGGQRLPN